MNPEGVGQRWFETFMKTVQAHEAATSLREASQSGKLRQWTEALTGVVISTLSPMGWRGAARGHRSVRHPVSREEYLALDVVAFRPEGDNRWPFPAAVFELENNRADDRVAYSLWKVLCVRTGLRVVFCYRRDADQGAVLVQKLADQVVRPMGLRDRGNVDGETLVVVGSRSEVAAFPYGFFKDWTLNANTGRFRRS